MQAVDLLGFGSLGRADLAAKHAWLKSAKIADREVEAPPLILALPTQLGNFG